ncbi:MAG TPA: protein kinase [Anaeromyxobacteraceae bacterium]|nr:protein kinase [Anaeromyxobacteraceae bacterium]
MDDVELWDLASHAPEHLRDEMLDGLASDPAQKSRVAELLAQPAPRPLEGPRYDIVGLIGAGTQADVYQARRLDLDRACALKVFRNVSDPAFVERVRTEAGLMARVLSPHVVTVFDAGDLGDGRFFIEMALCAEPDVQGSPGAIALGRSLRAYVLERGPLAPDEAARLLQPVCAAVAAAHRAGVVHSDVKPENVLVLPASRRAMLADFGIAASLTVRSPDAQPTRVGTIPYLAPEQFEDLKSPDSASDVYGLGGTLLFTLCGFPPHPERSADGQDPLGGSPVAVPASVPRSLAEIVERALAHEPSARPSAEELAGALDAFLARRPAPWELRKPVRRLSLFYQRHRVLLNLAFAGTVIAATLGLGLLDTVVAKIGLEARTRELSQRTQELDADVMRLESQRSALEAELARLGAEREEVAGAQAREREARLLAEGRSAEADAQLTAAEAQAREAAGKLEQVQTTAGNLEARLAESTARAKALEAEANGLSAEVKTRAENYRTSVEALREQWEQESTQLRQDLTHERETGANLVQRLEKSERDKNLALQAKTAAESKLEGRLEACRSDRDELKRELEELRAASIRAEAEAERPKRTGSSGKGPP